MHPQVALASSAASSAPDLLAQPDTIQRTLSIPARGEVTVNFSIQVDHNPEEYGIDLLFPTIALDTFSGFPVAEGTVLTTKRGYASMYGWTQLWKQSGDANDWEFDWPPVQTGLNWPFAWFGPQAQLFDGPTRVGVTDLDWTARSFLTYVEDSLMTRSVRCVIGFEWGFWIRNGTVVIKPLKLLEPNVDWDMHVAYLSTTFPGWQFK